MESPKLSLVREDGEIPAKSATGTRYTDEQKDLAFVVWSSKAGRNSVETANFLATADYLDFPPVTAKTIRNWVNEFGWVDRADKELHAQVPHLRYRTQLEVALGQMEAVRLLRQVVEASSELETDVAIKVKVGRDQEQIEVVRQIDWNGLKVRVQAATQLAAMAGLSPIGSRDVGEVMAPPSLLENARAAISEADPDQLAEIEASVLARIREQRKTK